MKEVILKIQRSIASNVEGSQLLVYNKSRDIQFTSDEPDPDLSILLPQGTYRGFYKARMSDSGESLEFYAFATEEEFENS